VAGGYVATASLVSALAGVLPLLGLFRSDAVMLASLLGFIIYLILLLWGAVELRLLRLCAGLMLLAGSGVAVVYLMKVVRG
jgi:hypothetical protein